MKRVLSILFKLIMSACAFTGVAMMLGANDTAQILSYYTNQSNLICAVVFLILAVLLISGKSFKDEKWYPIIKGAVTMCIMLTFLVFHFMLRPQFFQMGVDFGKEFLISNALVHYVAPLMVFFDYIIFDEKGTYKWYHPLTWTVIPLLYLGYIQIYNLFGGRFHGTDGAMVKAPYFFLDVEGNGLTYVLVSVLALLVAYIALSYVIMLFDKLANRLIKSVK